MLLLLLVVGLLWTFYTYLPSMPDPVPDNRQASQAEILYYGFPEEARDLTFEDFERELYETSRITTQEVMHLMLDRQLHYRNWMREGVPQSEWQERYESSIGVHSAARS